jgi:uncharacterized membrane protein YjfL (UPF0719 family)
MVNGPFLAALANVLLGVAAIGCFTFAILYQVLADWRASQLGRNVMAFMLVSGVLLSLGVVRAFVQPADHALEYARLIGYGVVAFIVWQRVVLLFRAQKTAQARRTLRDERADAHEAQAEARDQLADDRDERADARDARYDERDRAATPPGGIPRE